MNPDHLISAIGNDSWDERIIVDVRAASTVCGLRLILNDFTYLNPPQYFLNISKPETPSDPMGLHVGQPVKINPSVVDEALRIAADRSLGDTGTQKLIISHVLCFGEIKSEMIKKIGACHPEITSCSEPCGQLTSARKLEKFFQKFKTTSMGEIAFEFRPRFG